MHCTNCGTKNENDSVYCIKCGQNIKKEIICQQCQNANPLIAEYCHKCGTKLKKVETADNNVPYTTFTIAAVFLAILGVVAGTTSGAVYLALIAVGFYFRQKIAFGASIILIGGFFMLNAPLATPIMTMFNLFIGLFGLISLGILLLEIKEK